MHLYTYYKWKQLHIVKLNNLQFTVNQIKNYTEKSKKMYRFSREGYLLNG